MSLAAARARMETSLPRNPLPALSSPTAAPAHREDAELPVVPTSAVFLGKAFGVGHYLLSV